MVCCAMLAQYGYKTREIPNVADVLQQMDAALIKRILTIGRLQMIEFTDPGPMITRIYEDIYDEKVKK